MALTGTTGGDAPIYGIRLGFGLVALDTEGNLTQQPRVTIQRTSGTTAASTAGWTTIVTTRSGTTRYDDELPSDGKRRWYRVRQTLTGYEPSTWLGTVDAKPTILGESA